MRRDVKNATNLQINKSEVESQRYSGILSGAHSSEYYCGVSFDRIITKHIHMFRCSKSASRPCKIQLNNSQIQLKMLNCFEIQRHVEEQERKAAVEAQRRTAANGEKQNRLLDDQSLDADKRRSQGSRLHTDFTGTTPIL